MRLGRLARRRARELARELLVAGVITPAGAAAAIADLREP